MKERQDYFGEATRYFINSVDLMTRLWTDVATRSMSACFSFKPRSATPAAAREMRSDIFRSVSESADSFMRSPFFLDSMKRSFDTSVQYRKQLNNVLSRVQYEFQSASRQDVDNIMQMVNHIENRMTDEFERISEQLDGSDSIQRRAIPEINIPEKPERLPSTKAPSAKKSKAPKGRPTLKAAPKPLPSKRSVQKKRPAPISEEQPKHPGRRSKKTSRRRIYRVTPLPI